MKKLLIIVMLLMPCLAFSAQPLTMDGVLTVGAYNRHVVISTTMAAQGAQAPTKVEFGSGVCSAFEDDTDVVYIETRVPNDWDGASAFGLHIHWTTDDTDSNDAIAENETVKFDIEWRSVAHGAAFNAGTVDTGTVTYTAGAGEAANRTYESQIALTPSNQTIVKEDILLIDFKRDDTTDDYGTDNPCIIDWHIVYDADTFPDN